MNPTVEYLKAWLGLRCDRRAVTALEYGLIAAVLVTTVVVGFSKLGGAMQTSFNNIAGSL